MPEEGREQKQIEPESEKKEAKIRTMQSDVSEFLKETKPSLIALLSKEAEQKKTPFAITKKKPLLSHVAIIAVLALIVGLLGSYIAFNFFSEKEPRIVKIATPPILFATEKTRTINLKGPEDKTGIKNGLIDSIREEERDGTMKRILFKIREKSGSERFLLTEEFLNGLNVFPPSGLLPFLDKNFNLAIFYQGGIDGPKLIFASKTTDPERTEALMINWEIIMQRDLAPFFLLDEPKTRLAQFEDRSFRNIDWRFLKLDDQGDVGIAYAIFRAKNILIITTSKESMETIISRLFTQ